MKQHRERKIKRIEKEEEEEEDQGTFPMSVFSLAHLWCERVFTRGRKIRPARRQTMSLALIP
jgi:hypothetical protein